MDGPFSLRGPQGGLRVVGLLLGGFFLGLHFGVPWLQKRFVGIRVIKEYPSRSGKMKAVLYTRTCPMCTEKNTLAVMPSSAIFSPGKEVVLDTIETPKVQYLANSGYERGAWTLPIWATDDMLLVMFDGKSEILYPSRFRNRAVKGPKDYDRMVNGVKIFYNPNR